MFNEFELNKIKEAKLIYPEYIPKKITSQYQDLTGKTFNRLKVLYRTNDKIVGKNKVHKTTWVCLCECGNITIAITESLNGNKTKSCGCLLDETRILNNHIFKKKYNKYDFKDDICIGFTNNYQEFIFDAEDYDKVKDYCWCIDSQGYVCSNSLSVTGELKSVKIHRIIMSAQKDEYVDHINHNCLDNRKCNLRITTNQENCRNRSTQWNSTTGISGVNYKEKEGKWIARIYDNNRTIYLGIYDNFDDAVNARKEAEDKYYKEYSYDNSMKLSKNNKVSIKY